VNCPFTDNGSVYIILIFSLQAFSFLNISGVAHLTSPHLTSPHLSYLTTCCAMYKACSHLTSIFEENGVEKTAKEVMNTINPGVQSRHRHEG